MTDCYPRGLGNVLPSAAHSGGRRARGPTIRRSSSRTRTFLGCPFGTVLGEGTAIQQSVNFGNGYEQPFSDSENTNISSLGRRVRAVATKPEDLPRVRPQIECLALYLARRSRFVLLHVVMVWYGPVIYKGLHAPYVGWTNFLWQLAAL
jgi:hypothetical protein